MIRISIILTAVLMGVGLAAFIASPIGTRLPNASFDLQKTQQVSSPLEPKDGAHIGAERASLPKVSKPESGFEQLRDTLASAEVMTRDELIAVLGRFRAGQMSQSDFYTSHIYIERLLSIDAEFALTLVRKSDALSSNWMMYLSSWAEYDLGGAVSYIGLIANRRDRINASRILLSLEGIEDTQYASALLNEVGEEGQAILLKARLKHMPVELAFEEALAFLETGGKDSAILFGIVTRWRGSDLAGLFERFDTLENRALRRRLMRMVVGMVPTVQEEAMLALVMRYAPNDVDLLSQAIANTAEKNPLSALSMAEELAKKSGNIRALQGVLGQWVVHDVDAALSYVAELPMVQKKELSIALGVQFAQHSPEEAVYWALSLEGGLENVTATTLSVVNQYQPKLLEELLDTLSDPASLKKIRKVVWVGRAQTNPAQAVEDYLSDADNSVSDELFSRLLGAWQFKEPAAAAQFVSLVVHENPDIKNGGANLYRWYQADPEAVNAWIDSLPSESRPLFDGVMSLVNNLRGQSPRLAAEYLVKIPESSARASAARRVAHAWFEQEPESFDQMVEALELSEAARSHMRQHQTGLVH